MHVSKMNSEKDNESISRDLNYIQIKTFEIGNIGSS